MTTVGTITQAVCIFVVSLLVLFVISVLATANTHKAWGMGYCNAKGLMFMVLGALYLVFGFVLARWHFR